MDEDLGVRGGLEDRAVFLELFAQAAGVHEVAVVRDGHGAALVVDNEGLDVAQVAAAEGGVAHVANAKAALHARELVRLEDIRHEADPAVRGEHFLVVGADDAGAFLAAMLQRVEAEVDELGGLDVAKDAEHATLVLHMVVIVKGARQIGGGKPGDLRVEGGVVVLRGHGASSCRPVKR